MIEGDFVLGACAQRIFGYASRATDGSWSAFDDEARPIGTFADPSHAKAALWQAHHEAHDTTCAAPLDTRPRRAAPRRSAPLSETSDRVAAHPASW
ncbi:hypothetical protein M3D75_08680 [Microbacterium enclense]|uniref:hypothetical protein n=1 Tax=Microbacterium enclense TaxID=993073 RepID=UPI0021A4E225|nr:hypothetical protein [Microbacterium enclense]MCT2086185.1 hypothetical protein [Microbacterium enclense]